MKIYKSNKHTYIWHFYQKSQPGVCIYSWLSMFSPKLIMYLYCVLVWHVWYFALANVLVCARFGETGGNLHVTQDYFLFCFFVCFGVLFSFLIFTMMYMLTAHLQLPLENTLRLYRCKPKHSLSCWLMRSL